MGARFLALPALPSGTAAFDAGEGQITAEHRSEAIVSRGDTSSGKRRLSAATSCNLARGAAAWSLPGPLSVLRLASHASPGCTGCTRLRRMRRFTRNPVCGTKSHLAPNLSTNRAFSLPLWSKWTACQTRRSALGEEPPARVRLGRRALCRSPVLVHRSPRAGGSRGTRPRNRPAPRPRRSA